MKSTRKQDLAKFCCVAGESVSFWICFIQNYSYLSSPLVTRLLCMCMCTLTSFPSRAAASNKVNALMYIHTYIFFENFTLFFLMFLRSLFLLLSYICRYVRERALAICLSFALLHYQTVKIIWVCCPCVCVCLRIGVQTHTIIFRSSKKKKKKFVG